MIRFQHALYAATSLAFVACSSESHPREARNGSDVYASNPSTTTRATNNGNTEWSEANTTAQAGVRAPDRRVETRDVNGSRDMRDDDNRTTTTTTTTTAGSDLATNTPATTPSPTPTQATPNTNADDRLTAQDQSETEADRDITAAIRRTVVADDSLSMQAKNVAIITRASVVTLRGEVPTAREKTAIERAARATRGVRRVDSTLQVSGQ